MKQAALELLANGTHTIAPLADFERKLASGRPLVIKLGADPTAPDLHLGHAVVLSKMRQFQDLGHKVIFLIGDFTARIGDPTGRSKTRPPLSEEQIKHNTKTYFEQVSKILDPERVTIRYNSEWLGNLSSVDWVTICAKTTLARLIEREDFANRLQEHQPIGFHELLYPLMQGYDSVALKADIELGGTDQTFNLLVGRDLQEHFGQEGQVIMTLPLLPGLDGVQKMSKSLGNAIGLAEPAEDAYGKIMSISDDLMWMYYHLLLHRSPVEIDTLKAEISQGLQHPMNIKKALSHGIISRFWSTEAAESAQKHFEALFQNKDLSQASEVALSIDSSQALGLVDLLKQLGTVASSSEARRLIESGAVSIDGKKLQDIHAKVIVQNGMVIKAGKHKFYKLTLKT